MTQKTKFQIGVIGAGSCTPDEADAAYRVGREIARRGAVLVCGGLGGVMEAACRGARDGGGTTVGLLPTDRKVDANLYVDIVIVTGMGHARNAIVAASSDVLVAVGGEYGTLSEIALGLKMGKTVISLQGGWDIQGLVVVKEAEDAVDMAFKILLQ
ncbi:MAG: TIGR00725 family protein [ANME-2 cluster archaeon]|nr:TIGR00725 family protein [ANME-2 cluster archaeon]